MNDAEVLRQLSHKTGFPESTAEAVMRGLRELIRDGELDPQTFLTEGTDEHAVVSKPAPLTCATCAPEDPSLVDEVIARARRHPLGLEFLASGFLASVAIILGAHAFTVEAARARLRAEQSAAASEQPSAVKETPVS